LLGASPQILDGKRGRCPYVYAALSFEFRHLFSWDLARASDLSTVSTV
jgi:hypothetical protein